MNDNYIEEKLNKLEQTIVEVKNLLNKMIEQVNLLILELKDEQ